MPFNDIATLTGIIQRMEEYTGLGNSGISGDTVKLKRATNAANDSFDELMPLILSATSTEVQWDDENNTDQPIATFNLVANQSDYKLSADANGLAILDIKKVRILPTTTATTFIDIPFMDGSDPRVADAMSPNTTLVGTPYRAVKRGNTLFFWPPPQQNITNGGKIYFERIQSYFVYTDETKVPGIPRIFHSILPKIASYKWLLINKPDATALIAYLANQIAADKKALHDFIATRSPSRRTITTKPVDFI